MTEELPEPHGYLHDTGEDDGEWCQTLNPNPLRTFFRTDDPRKYGQEPRNLRAVYTADQVRELILAERERCAGICERWGLSEEVQNGDDTFCRIAAAEIREA